MIENTFTTSANDMKYPVRNEAFTTTQPVCNMNTIIKRIIFLMFIYINSSCFALHAQQNQSDTLPGKTPDKLKPLSVNVPTDEQPESNDYNELILITSSTHDFAHDGRLVYYLGVPLPDSDYRKDVKVVKHFYEQFSDPMDEFMSPFPPDRFRQIIYISNNGNLYYQSIKLEDTDPDNFEGVKSSVNGMEEKVSDVYIRSNNRIYYREKELKGINADKFHIIPIGGYSSFYVSDSVNIYYNGDKLQGADPDNFEGVKSFVDDMEEKISEVYIRSNNSIYYQEKELKGINADKAHVIPIGGYPSLYISDGVNIYYNGDKLEGVDAGSFQIINYHSCFGKDYKHLYFGSEIVEGLDRATFENINPTHVKDKNGLYMLTYFPQCDNPRLLQNGGVECNGKVYFFLSSSRRNVVLNTPKDTTQRDAMLNMPKDSTLDPPFNDPSFMFTFDPESDVYKYMPADPESFEIVLNNYYALYTRDKNHVYLNGNVIDSAKPQDFHVNPVDISYAMDKNHVFYNGKLIEDADPKTFKKMDFIYRYSDYYRDKRHIYYWGRKVEGLSAANFDISKFYYKSDGKVWLRVPRSNVLQFCIEEADTATFQTFDSMVDDFACLYAKDSQHAYYHGMPMQGVDVASFQPYENSGYAYDKNNLYFNGQRVPITGTFNPEGFSIISYMYTDGYTDGYSRNVYTQDNRNMYYNGRVLQDHMPGCLPEFYNNRRNDNRFCIFVYCGGRIYCRGKLIKKGSKEDIRIYLYSRHVSPFWSDDINIYYEDKIIAKAEDGLEALDSEYAIIGGNRVFYMDEEIAVSDVKTFQTQTYGHYAKDKNHVYFEGKKLKHSNPDKFDTEGLGYAKDNAHIFYEGEIIEGADPEHTQVRYGYLTDYKYIYYQGKRYEIPTED